MPSQINPLLPAATNPRTSDVRANFDAAKAEIEALQTKLTVADAKTLTANNTLTLAGTDATTITFQGTDTYVGRATTDVLTKKTLTAPAINGGTIDGTIIGASTPAAGTFTTISGTLTNCTGLPAAGVTGSALVAADIGTTVQAPLVSGTSIKTVNGTSLLGSGNIDAIAAEVITPTNVSPANAATDQTETPTLTGSTFFSNYSATHANTQVQVHTTSDFTTPQYSSGDQAGSISFTLPAGHLAINTTYHWRMRYKNSRGTYSEWSSAFSFTTAASFGSYIATPTATPSNFGDALEGGFYTGMMWNQIAQASDSKLLATGTQTFTVPSMTGSPIVYAGQTIEVRSRANPANKFIGTVTGAVGTTLTLNVSSIGGSGTFSDWSVMSRFRVIVAPKSSGENASVTYKNANTAAPAATGTLTEGWLATEAMRTADTSTVYPAAHWARGLNIGGRTDWYVPARDELELCWRNLKPVTNNNYVTADRPTAATPSYANLGSVGDTANTHGLNNNSSPTGAAYTTTVPGQVAATAFRTGGAEAFEFGSSYYWSSTEYSASVAWFQHWDSSFPGYQNNGSKTNANRVRAVRRSII